MRCRQCGCEEWSPIRAMAVALASTLYFATVVCPTSMSSMRSSPWIRGAPQKRVRNAHVANELNLQWCLRSTAARPRFPAPIGSETGAVPADHRFRLEDFQCVQHARSKTIQSRKHQAINATEGLCVPKIRFGNIGGEARPGSVVR
jgi:hypothetical protein